MEFNDVFSELFELNGCTTLKAKYKSRLDFETYKNSEAESFDFGKLQVKQELRGATNLIWYATCKALNSLFLENKTENVHIIFKKVSGNYKYETYVNNVKKDSLKVENLLK